MDSKDSLTEKILSAFEMLWGTMVYAYSSIMPIFGFAVFTIMFCWMLGFLTTNAVTLIASGKPWWDFWKQLLAGCLINAVIFPIAYVVKHKKEK